MIRPDHPRRYVQNEAGEHVLVGLTVSETRELEGLEALSLGGYTEAGSASAARAGDERWVELYAKHGEAWRAWLSRSGASGQDAPFQR